MEPIITPFDIIPLPSEGILYPGKQKTVKTEFLTSMDESTLTSANLADQGLTFDILLERKVKDLKFDQLDLLRGDRMAILIWLRATGHGNLYPIAVWSQKEKDYIKVDFDLSTLKYKKLTITPDENGEFSWEFPMSKKKIKFILPTGRTEKEMTRKDTEWMKTSGNESDRGRFMLEEHIKEIDGERDIVKILQTIAVLPLRDSLEFKKYLNSVEPGIDFAITVKTPGGESIDTFLRIRADFFLL